MEMTSCSCGDDCKNCENCSDPKCECFCDLYVEEEGFDEEEEDEDDFDDEDEEY